MTTTEIIDEENIDTVEENYTERINNNKDASFASLFNTPELSDIVLSVNAIYTYHAHKLVLASRSEVFKAMLSAKWNEKELKTLELHETAEAQDNFHDFLYYIYSGVVNLHLTNVAGLYTLADKYNIQCLRSSTMQYMSEHIATNSRNNQTLNWLVWAQSCRNVDFERKCYNFIINNFAVVVNSSHWSDIDLNNLINILKSSDLVVQEECEVFEAVEKWLLTKEREAVPLLLKSLIPYLRLAQIWPVQLSHLEQHSDILQRYKKFLIPELLDAYRYQSLPLESRIILVAPQVGSSNSTGSTMNSITNHPISTASGGNTPSLANLAIVDGPDAVNGARGEEDDTGSTTESSTSDNEVESIILELGHSNSSVHNSNITGFSAAGNGPAGGIGSAGGPIASFNEPKYKMRTYINKNFCFSLELKQEGDHYGPLTFATAKSCSFLDQSAWQWNLKLYYNASNTTNNKLKISISDVYNKQGYLWNNGGPGNTGYVSAAGQSSHHHHHHMPLGGLGAAAKRNLQIAFLIGHKKRDGFYYKQYKYMHDFSECESFELVDFFKDWNLSQCTHKIKLIIVMKPVTEI